MENINVKPPSGTDLYEHLASLSHLIHKVQSNRQRVDIQDVYNWHTERRFSQRPTQDPDNWARFVTVSLQILNTIIKIISKGLHYDDIKILFDTGLTIPARKTSYLCNYNYIHVMKDILYKLRRGDTNVCNRVKEQVDLAEEKFGDLTRDTNMREETWSLQKNSYVPYTDWYKAEANARQRGSQSFNQLTNYKNKPRRNNVNTRTQVSDYENKPRRNNVNTNARTQVSDYENKARKNNVNPSTNPIPGTQVSDYLSESTNQEPIDSEDPQMSIEADFNEELAKTKTQKDLDTEAKELKKRQDFTNRLELLRLGPEEKKKPRRRRGKVIPGQAVQLVKSVQTRSQSSLVSKTVDVTPSPYPFIDKLIANREDEKKAAKQLIEDHKAKMQMTKEWVEKVNKVTPDPVPN